VKGLVPFSNAAEAEPDALKVAVVKVPSRHLPKGRARDELT